MPKRRYDILPKVIEIDNELTTQNQLSWEIHQAGAFSAQLGGDERSGGVVKRENSYNGNL